MDFVAIDFETANSSYDSACAIGITVVENLSIVDTLFSYIRPEPFIFDEGNIRVHNIHPDDVINAPTFPQLWPKIRPYFNPHHPVLAHNAIFDMSVLYHSLRHFSGIFDFTYVDTMSFARRFVNGSPSLRNCADEFCIDMGTHHDPLSDSKTCAQFAVCCMQKMNCISIWEFLAKNEWIKLHSFADLNPPKHYTTKSKKRTKLPEYSSIKISDLSPSNNCFDCSHPLYGKNVVFTGELSIDRKTAMQMAIDVGAVVKSSVSSKTDYLIVGKQDKDLVGEDGKSHKEEVAYSLISSGKANISILNEEEFLSLLKQN